MSSGCRQRPDQEKRYAVKVVNQALEGATGATDLHMCFGLRSRCKKQAQGLLIFA